jgi:hypothetical protein
MLPPLPAATVLPAQPSDAQARISRPRESHPSDRRFRHPVGQLLNASVDSIWQGSVSMACRFAKGISEIAD